LTHHRGIPPGDALSSGTLLERIEAQERELEQLRARLSTWEAAFSRLPARDHSFTTISGVPVAPLYTPADRQPGWDYLEQLGLPGEFPFTRGPYTSMYRTRLWTMRQFAGFGTAEETNRRYKYLLEHGQTGLSVAFDFPTLMGYDSDHPRSLGEVGKCGVAISIARRHGDAVRRHPARGGVRLHDDQRPGDHPVLLLRRRGGEAGRVAGEKLRGTVQNDILKEYMAQHAWIYPVEPALKLIVDMFEWASHHAPKYNPISISGYHIREAGATAAQELAYTLRNGFEYVERGIARGLDVDDFAPRLSFFFDVHNDFFEEIAKFRAARRIWAKRLRDVYGAKKEESWRLRTHAQTAGVTLVAQQPENNIVRVAYQALAAVLGGTQSLHTNSMDETLALPTEKSVRIALRTQQVAAFESGVANTIDPLAGSYFVEAETDRSSARRKRSSRRSNGSAASCAASRWATSSARSRSRQSGSSARSRAVTGSSSA
jgi:methylmalonyl-CoA mutase, N-terminal domain